MADTSARMLRLLSLLQTHRFWPGTELACRLGVSGRTLRRDIDRLRELGYPVTAARGTAGGYQLQAGSVLPPLVLDDEEAVAIAVGLRAAAGDAVDGIAESSVRALTKLVLVLPPRLRRRVQALQTATVPLVRSGGPSVDPAVLTTLAQACRDEERLRFDYGGRDGARTSRHVEPHRLVSRGRRWYLVAWDLERHDWRTFRVDRLDHPVPTRVRFRPRELPRGDAATFVRDRIAAVPTKYRVVVTIDAPAADVARVVGPWGVVEPLEPRSCRWTINADTLDWPTFVLAAVGAEFTVLEPPGLHDHLRRTSELFARGAKSSTAS